jgi:hypothetical protein
MKIDGDRSTTASQLKRQIGYYAGLALRATSRERIRLAHVAIASREQRLRVLTQVDLGPKEER